MRHAGTGLGILHGMLMAVWAIAGSSAEAQEFYLSGGGTNQISSVINANAATGGTIILEDSATYTETGNLVVGQRYNATDGRRGFSIRSASGAEPTIVLDGAAFLTYSGADDVKLGSLSGGTIHIDARLANTGSYTTAFHYIGYEDGLSSGAASLLTLENLNIEADDTRLAILMFGLSGQDSNPNTTGAKIYLNHVRTFGSQRGIWNLYNVPADHYNSTLEIERSVLAGARDFGVLVADRTGSGTQTILSNTVVTNAAANYVTFFRGGDVTIDHCDIIAEGAAARAVWLLDNASVPSSDEGTVTISNSILRGAYAVSNSAVWTVNVVDSNVSSPGGTLYAGSVSDENTISEWPVYLATGTDLGETDNFVLEPTSASASHGNSPPIGSGGVRYVPVSVSAFQLD